VIKARSRSVRSDPRWVAVWFSAKYLRMLAREFEIQQVLGTHKNNMTASRRVYFTVSGEPEITEAPISVSADA
jgi:hypothetical protein